MVNTERNNNNLMIKIEYNYSGIPISRTSKGNENWFEKSMNGVRNTGSKIIYSETNPRETTFGSNYRSF